MILRTAATFATALFLSFVGAVAQDLKIYNWEDYTAPELIQKFQRETGVRVSLETYQSNEELLAKLRSGAGDYDLVVPTQNVIEAMVREGMLQKVHVHEMANFKNIDERWRKPSWDPKQEYSAPWHWGTASFAYRADLYSGNGSSLGEYFEPRPEIKGRLQVLSSPDETINLAHIYLGTEICSEDQATMLKVRDLLLRQKESVLLYSNQRTRQRIAIDEIIMTGIWSGDALRARLEDNPHVRYALPKEGVVGWFDSLVVPTGAKNVETARAFMNFAMDPGNMAIQSNFSKYANAIPASSPFLGQELKDARELHVPADLPVRFSEACSQKAQRLVEDVWSAVVP
ncbi:MAG: extracellular solute-binding protein [Hyphomicrobiaceae bacterium]